MKSLPVRLKPGAKGQSFVELAIVLGALRTLLLGMVEMAYLLNTYITVVDASRQGARVASTKAPYNTTDDATPAAFFTAVPVAAEAQQAIAMSREDPGGPSPILPGT